MANLHTVKNVKQKKFIILHKKKKWQNKSGPEFKIRKFEFRYFYEYITSLLRLKRAEQMAY